LLIALVDAVFDQRHGRTRCQHIGLAATTAPIRRLGGFDLQAALVALRHQRIVNALFEVAVEPGDRGVALQPGQVHRPGRPRAVALAFEAAGAGPALSFTRPFLGDADGAHREVVARQAEAVGTVDRQCVEAETQHRIGLLARRHGRFTRAARGGVLSKQLAGSVFRQGQRLGERERARPGLRMGTSGSRAKDQRN